MNFAMVGVMVLLLASFQAPLLDPVPGVVIHAKGSMDYAKYLKCNIFWQEAGPLGLGGPRGPSLTCQTAQTHKWATPFPSHKAPQT